MQQYLVPVDDVVALAKTIDRALQTDIAIPSMRRFALDEAVQRYLALSA